MEAVSTFAYRKPSKSNFCILLFKRFKNEYQGRQPCDTRFLLVYKYKISKADVFYINAGNIEIMNKKIFYLAN